MSVQDKAVERAIAFLKASGAQYRIVMGDAVVADTIPAPEPKKVHRIQVNDFAAEFDYIGKMKAMQPGDTLTWPKDAEHFPEGDKNRKWNSFCSCISSRAKALFGEDKYIVDNKTNESITILRVE